MTVGDQASDEPGAHAPKPDHSELHWVVRGQGSSPFRPALVELKDARITQLVQRRPSEA
jgi:hypothetical protein